MSDQSTGAVEKRLAELGLTLPQTAKPLAAYVPAVVVGNLVYTSGQLPVVNGEVPEEGAVGREVSADSAKEHAQTAALNALAAIKAEIGDLDRVTRIVKLTGYVSSAPDFYGQPGVINGASELIGSVFEGEVGQHARAAVGVAALPMNVPVEVDIIAEFR
ncbi:RidA family protein [Helcobacillus massiliensis]|uniref:Enamine deaminase RidA (YjgF/YER057c/UK114 family) n=1 Tax=Helcobacillus massiliensis TaxID=521392 RepID=A0A839QT12_9MICO|nr:RidA family protein [Helcobacillus massiliensis]MCG7427059.1 RidA family protein [Helcobacillus sp. ACRRO]MBB3023192.1 enamine deaminase RidA (YjgF/YER057c/UK114 family) [Helcobacillus massiliensis]MCT1556632.1 RidA family protein [Helcobacillus massiliensis]MCT2035826.1 RidA family protein [Helcobacillus massiliensis]MCT2331092.1 RidA family protein [Helcobacillus massiliensis]